MPPAIIAAAIGGVASIGGAAIASNAAGNAADKSIAAQNQASANSLALQQQIYNQTQTNNAPFLATGTAANSALATQYGLTAPGGGGSDPARTSVIGNQGMGGYGSPTAAPGAPSYNSYLGANPDLAAEAQRVTSDGEFPSVQAYLQWHDQNYGSEGRNSTADPTAAAATSTGTGTPAPVPGLDALGGEPTFSRPGAGSFDVGSYFKNFTADPGYDFTRSEALRAVNAKSAAPGGSGFFSGARGKALEDRATNLANQTYNDWWNRQSQLASLASGQFNADRNVLNSNFQSDRGFTQGQYDTNRDYLTQRSDTATNNLFKLAGMGQSSANATSAAGANYANQGAQQYNNNANVLSSAYGTQATATGGLASGIANSIGNVASAAFPTGSQAGWGGNGASVLGGNTKELRF